MSRPPNASGTFLFRFLLVEATLHCRYVSLMRDGDLTAYNQPFFVLFALNFNSRFKTAKTKSNMDEHKKFLADRLLSEEQPVCFSPFVTFT